MKKAYNQIITVQQNQHILHLSIAQKQNDTGIFWNQRLLVLNQGNYFGYIGKFKPQDNPQEINLDLIKQKVTIKCIKSVKWQTNNLTIKFLHQENLKQIQKKWVFKMTNQKIIGNWLKKFQLEKNKRVTKSIEKNQYSSISKSKNADLSPRIYPVKQQQFQKKPNQIQKKSQQKAIIQPQPQKKQEIKNQAKLMIEKVSEKQIQQSQQKQQFQNPLFGYDSYQSSSIKKTITPKKSQSQAQKIEPKNQKNNKKILQYRNIQQKQNQISKKNQIKNQIKNQKRIQILNYDQQKSKQNIKTPKNQSNFSNEKSQTKNYSQLVQQIVAESVIKHNQAIRQKKQYTLDELLKFQQGETQKFKKQSKFQQILINNQIYKNNQQLSPQRKNQIKMMQNYAINLQKQKLKNQNISNFNYQEHKKQIAQIIRQRNNRFQKKIIKQIKQQQKKNISIFPFSFRYLSALSFGDQNQQDIAKILNEYRIYCENLMKQIIQDIYLSNNQINHIFKYKIKQKLNNLIIYQHQQTQIKIATTSLKSITTKNNANNEENKQKQVKQQKISDFSSAKQLQIQFKNYNLLTELLKKTAFNQQQKQNQIKSKLRTPLIILVQYNGFTGLFKLMCKTSQKSFIDQAQIHDKQRQITKFSNIQINMLSKDSKFKILHIDDLYYTQMYKKYNNKPQITDQSSNNKQKYLKNIFNFDMIQQIDSFLLKDYLSKTSNGILRKQFIQLMTQQNQNLKNIIFSNPSRNLTDPKIIKNKEDNLKILSNQILQKLSQIILKLDSLEFYYMHPNQLSNFFHLNGINMRYIGLAYDNLNQSMSKRYLMTQIAARVCKLLFKKSLQDIHLEKTQSKLKDNKLLLDVIDFLNCLTGTTFESTAIWKVLQFHSVYYFKTKINKQQIQKGYFLVTLAYHCRINLNWKKISTNLNQLFSKDDYFTLQNVLGLEIHSKTYDPDILSIKYQKLTKLLKQKQSQNGFKQIMQILELKNNIVPYLTNNQSSPLHQSNIRKYLSHFIQPQSIYIKHQKSLSHLSSQIFDYSVQYPQRKTLFIKIVQIKWYLKLRKKQKYLKKCEQFISFIQGFYQDFHLSLSQLYDIFSNFHLFNGQYQDSITFAKSSLINIIKICGTNHTKTSEAYYNLGLVNIKANRIQQSLNLLKKGKTIFQSKNQIQTNAYATINLKLGLLMLNKGQTIQCTKIIQKALQIYNTLIQNENQQKPFNQNTIPKIQYEDQKCQCMQILSRCYQLNKSKQKIISLSRSTQKYLPLIRHPQNLQKILRVALYSHLINMPIDQASRYLDIISVIPVQITPKTYHKSYTLLKVRIKQKSLIQNFENYLQNLSSIDDFISVNGTLKNWKSMQKVYQRQTVNDFISLTQEILYFLGEGYMTGVLRENLNK